MACFRSAASSSRKKAQRQLYVLTISNADNGIEDGLVEGNRAANCPAYQVAQHVAYDMMALRFYNGHAPLAPWDRKRFPNAEVSIVPHSFSTVKDRDAALVLCTAKKSSPGARHRCKRSDRAICKKSFAIPVDTILSTLASSCQVCGDHYAPSSCIRCGGRMCLRSKLNAESHRRLQATCHPDMNDDFNAYYDSVLRRSNGHPWCSDKQLCALCEYPSDCPWCSDKQLCALCECPSDSLSGSEHGKP